MKHDDEANFSRRMSELRSARKMSQSELARRMAERGFENYSQMTVSRTEKGERPIRLGEARAIAEILESRVDAMTRDPRAAELIAEMTAEQNEMTEAILKVMHALQQYEFRSRRVDEYRARVSALGDEMTKEVNTALSNLESFNFPLSAVIDWAITAAKDRRPGDPRLYVGDILEIRNRADVGGNENHGELKDSHG